jgi:hypothetical protein
MNPGTGGFAFARGHSFRIARFQIHQIDLKERISRLTFALKNHLPPIGTEVAFSGSAAFEGQLSSSADESCFQLLSLGGVGFRDISVGGRSGLLSICGGTDSDANAKCSREPPGF